MSSLRCVLFHLFKLRPCQLLLTLQTAAGIKTPLSLSGNAIRD